MIFVWLSMLIFFVSYTYLCVQTISGRWTVRTKWSEMTREQWLIFGGMVQFAIPLAVLSVIAFLRS